MRKLSSAALALFLLPGVGCINLDLANGAANVFEAEIDASGTGLLLAGGRNIKFKQIVTIDPTTDEQRAGAVATDQINFEVISIEFSYLLEEMNELEEAIDIGAGGALGGDVVTDPRGLVEDFNVFQVGDIRMTPFVVGMFVTYTRKEVILDERLIFDGDVFDFVDGFKERNVRTVESRPAFCNFIDPNGAQCFAFDTSKVDGLNIGAVAGVGKDLNEDGILQNIDNDDDGVADEFEIEDTSSAVFNDLIVVDPVIYMTLLEGFLEENLGAPLDADQIEDLAKEAIMIRIARDNQGALSIFNNNLGEDFR
jgi:hypothetical protein